MAGSNVLHLSQFFYTTVLPDIFNTKEVQDFIQLHQEDEPSSLVLNFSSQIPHIKEIAAQIQSRKKAKTKLPEWFSQPQIIFPHGVSMEQCSSEQTALYKASLVAGESVVDLTGGFGIDLFYLSKKFKQATYVEQNAELTALVSYNYQCLDARRITIINSTAEEYLQLQNIPPTHYYLDPARRDDGNQKVFHISDCRPDLTVIVPELLIQNAEIMIKLSPLLDINAALKVIPNVKEVHVVSVKNECKELLFRVVPKFNDQIHVIAINLMEGSSQRFEFTEADESQSPTYGQPQTYLYEPNASIMKAGGFNTVAHRFGLIKIQRNSHLYTSDALIENFPGRRFIIKVNTVLNKKKLKKHLPHLKANITVRNYPLSVKEIRNKTGIKDGGAAYCFATTLMDGTLAFLICEKI